jgi:5-methylcytosine-specific restriction endonuclease McrA
MTKPRRPVTGMRAFSVPQRRAIRADLFLKFGPYCQICLAQGKSKEAAKIDMGSVFEDDSFSVDHVVALADGGTNTPDNFHPTHIACNERKGSKKVPGRVRSNRKPKAQREGFNDSGVRLAYTSSS